MRQGMKVKRVLPSSKQRVFGLPPKQVLEKFSREYPNHKNQRLYLLPGKEESAVIKAVLPSKQLIFNVKQTQGKELEFHPAGAFNAGFTHREVFGIGTPRGAGIGRAALRTELAIARKHGQDQHIVNSQQKSSTLLFLKEGYKIDPTTNRQAMAVTGIRTEKQLIEFLKNPSTPEELKHGWNLVRQIKPSRK